MGGPYLEGETEGEDNPTWRERDRGAEDPHLEGERQRGGGPPPGAPTAPITCVGRIAEQTGELASASAGFPEELHSAQNDDSMAKRDELSPGPF